MLQIGHCIAILMTIFALYPSHRESLISDIFPIIPHLPTSKTFSAMCGSKVDWFDLLGKKSEEDDEEEDGDEENRQQQQQQQQASAIGSGNETTKKPITIQNATLLLVGMLQVSAKNPIRVLEIEEQMVINEPESPKPAKKPKRKGKQVSVVFKIGSSSPSPPAPPLAFTSRSRNRSPIV